MTSHFGGNDKVSNVCLNSMGLNHILCIKLRQNTNETDNLPILFGNKNAAVPFTTIIEQMFYIGCANRITLNSIILN